MISLNLLQCLTVYVFAHLLLCTGDQTQKYPFQISSLCISYCPSCPSLLGSFKHALQEWKTWDTIKMIQRHREVKRSILGFFYNNLQVCHSNFILPSHFS